MLWFNRDKGHGYIRTEAGERLYVAETGFLPGEGPEGRCKGLTVTFERVDDDGDAQAVGVTFDTADVPRRARMRRARGGAGSSPEARGPRATR